MIFEKIRRYSKEKGMTIPAIEEAAGLGNGTICKWKKSSPSVDKLLAVAKVLEVDISALLPDSREV